MNLLSRLVQRRKRNKDQSSNSSSKDQADFRRCRFESMEPRRMLDADPVVRRCSLLRIRYRYRHGIGRV